MDNIGVAIAVIGAALAALMPGIGSAMGVGMVGEASTGVLAEDPSKYGKLLILQLLPGTQGLYGLVIAFMLLNKIGIIGGGEIAQLTVSQGLLFFGACLPMAFVGLWSAVRQARAAVGGVGLVAKRPDQNGKAITISALVETYALLALVISLLPIMGINI